MLRTHCWSLLLPDEALGNTHIGLGEQMSMLLSPYVTSNFAIMVALFMSPLGNDRASWEKSLAYLQNGSSYPLEDYLNPPLLRSTFVEHFHGTYISLGFSPTYGDPSIYLFSRFPYHQFSNDVPSKFLTAPSKYLSQPINH